MINNSGIPMHLRESFQVMAKPSGPICNMDCKYCFYLEKENLYSGSQSFKMSEKVLEELIKQKIEANKINEVGFAWQGGEPTLRGLDFFRQAVELQKKYANGKRITNGFQTNGILLDDEWCEFFKENNFLVGVSIDGPKEIHDKYRVDKGNEGTFDKVLRGIKYLKKHNVDFNTLTVVQRDNAEYPLEIYNFLKDIGSGYMQFIPIVERMAYKDSAVSSLKLVLPSEKDAEVSEWSVLPEQYGNFLCAIFDEWVRNDVGKYFVQMFDVALQSWVGMSQSLCVFRETCGDAMIIEHNGDIYSCDHFVYPEHKLGNILESPLESLVNSNQQFEFGEAKASTLPNYCLNCEVKFACNGECPKHRFIKTPDGEEGLNYLCAAYKKFFNHVDPYMKYMMKELRNERSPANVMEWANEKDKGFPSLKVGRNDLCPCGSGMKYKFCCGA
jgi:serine-type anaerobic sulfatase-maturating enzyme